MPMLANIIFPAPSAAYVVSIFLPFLAIWTLGSEVGVFWLLQQQSRGKGLVAAVIAANIVSWLCGLVLTSSKLFPSGLVTGQGHILTQGPDWHRLAYLSFGLAFGISSALEYGALLFVAGRLKLRRLLWTVVAANAVSYSGIVLCMLVVRL